MKNKVLLLGLLFSLTSFAQNLLNNGNFSNGLASWTPFNCCGPTLTFNGDNNEANMIGIAGTGGAIWQIQLNQVLTSGQIGQLTVGSSYKISFDARSNVASRQLRMFFGQDGGGFTPVNIYDVNLNSQMTNYSVVFTVNATYPTMKLGFEMGLSNAPVWIDNVVLEPFVGPVAPNQPTGFVASNTISGNPVGSGEVFLSCGGNQAGTNNVVYRVFYAPTASAPVDPTTATQHTFGTIAGDNGGNGAFGFVIPGLIAGTSYTVWLYQYNTSTMLYSTPAIATVVSGGSLGGPIVPSQPVGFGAANTISGTPVGAGQAFLSCGPNNVASAQINYKLFFAPTASAPVDPTTATEYVFGTTAGDGGANAAFGFSISGLIPNTSYTFWLYQYNSTEMTLSTPAIATVVSGATPPTLVGPTTNPAQPTCPVGNVVSVYGDHYPTNIATNYNPNWGQSGFGVANPNFNPGTGNPVLAYPNFNYQGINVTQTNLSAMEFITFDIWTQANPTATTIRVSPINNTGVTEVLVTVPFVQGQWTKIELHKSLFTGMTWNAVKELKFAANGPGSTVPVNIFVDNIFFSTCGTLPPPPPPVAPTTNPAQPTCPVGNVVSVYGDHYPTNIATNYNPNWGQSGFGVANPNFNPGTGNPVLAYPNFNYQGINVTQTNLSAMEFITFDIWTQANPTATTIRMSPINNTGVAEVLVNIPFVQGQWTKIELHKSLFTGMTWNAVKELKFAANGPGSTVPVNIYLDNIFFSTCGTLPPPPPPVAPTTNPAQPVCPPGNIVSIYGDHYPTNIATNYNPNWGQSGFNVANPNFNPGTGNPILAYPNFNYQGINVTQTNLSNMQFLRFDVYTAANPSNTTLRVSPINQGTGAAEVLVNVPFIQGQWTTIVLPKSLFVGMTWNNVKELKFAANSPGSVVPIDLYLDNIFFSVDCTPCVTSLGVANVNSCGPITWIDGNTYTTSNNTATHLLPGVAQFGCDSLITLNYTRWTCTQLQNNACGATNVSMSQIINAVNVNAPAYRFRITGVNNGGQGWSTGSFVYDAPAGQRHFRFQFIPGAIWGGTYTVEVATGNGMGNFSPYSTACIVTLQNQTTTVISSTSCGTSVSGSQFVSADWAPGAVAYRFRIQGANNGGTGWVNNMFEYVTTAPVRKFTFGANVPGAVFGSTYSIDVAVQSADGSWLSYGTPCNVTLAAPTTQIQTSQCGISNVLPETSVLADPVAGASGYRFKFVGPNSANWVNNTFTVDRPNRTFWFNLVAGSLIGETYQVTVAVMDANGNYGAYGSMCSVTRFGVPALPINENDLFVNNKTLDGITFDATASHNPFTTDFGIQVLNANDSETINVVIYDMSGKLIERQAVNPMDIENAKFGANLASGMYMIEVKQGTNQAVIRQVKN